MTPRADDPRVHAQRADFPSRCTCLSYHSLIAPQTEWCALSAQLNTAIGGTNDFVYLITADLGTPSGEGFDFVDGMVFLERFYYVFDSANSQVGFATTQFTNSTVN